MLSFGVVLDACVLIPATLRDTLIRAVEKGMYNLHWSDGILDEVRRKSVQKQTSCIFCNITSNFIALKPCQQITYTLKV
jgi:predicted nucleic acid-binding protein